jgi:hypothetical protein
MWMHGSVIGLLMAVDGAHFRSVRLAHSPAVTVV